MDAVITNIDSQTIVGGSVDGTGDGGSDNYSTGLYNTNGNSDKAFTVFDLTSLPSYVVSALEAGTLQVTLTFTTSTSSIVGRTVYVHAGVETPAVATEIKDSSQQNSSAAWDSLDGSNFAQVATIEVKKGVPPFSSSQNQNAAQTVNITTQVVAALKGNSPNLMLWFDNTGDETFSTTNISNLSVAVSGIITEPDTVANSGPSIVTGAVSFAPFAGLTVSSSVPAELGSSSGTLVVDYTNDTSTQFGDESVPITNTNFYQIVQSNAAAGKLSGAGLTSYPPQKAGEAIYQITGTTAQISAELQALVFTPSVTASGQAAGTTFTLEEGNAPGGPGGAEIPLANGVITYAGSSDSNDSVTTGASEVVLSGGTTTNNLVITTETVQRGGTASGTSVIDGGTLTVTSDGQSANSVVTGGKEIIEAGGTSLQTMVRTGGVEDVLAGGKARMLTVESNGSATIYGTVNSGTVDGAFQTGFQFAGDGKLIVETNGVVDNIEVDNHGELTVNSSGQANSLTVSSGGSVTVMSNGRVNQLTVAGGTVIVENGGSVIGAINFTSAGGTLKIDTPLSHGTATYQDAIAGLTNAASIDLTGLAYTSSSMATVGGSRLTVTNGGVSEIFNLQGSSATSFYVANDGGGGTLILPDFVPVSNQNGGENFAVVPPSISGEGTVVAGQQTFAFANAEISDANPGSADTLTIQMSGDGAGGTLTGPDLSGGIGGTYSLAGTASAITTELQQIEFTPSTQPPNSSVTVNFTLTDVTTAGTSAGNAGFNVTVATPAVAPTVSGAFTQTVTSEAATAPFVSATVTDPNVDSTEVVTIAVDGASGVLSCTGLTSPAGVYTLTGTATQVTDELQALVFTPTPGTPNGSATTTLEVTDTTTAGPAASDGNFIVTNADPAVAPTLTGSAALSVQSETTSQPFATAVLTDPNANSTDVLAIELSGAGGTLSGTGLEGSAGDYTLSGTAAEIEPSLQALVFTPVAEAPGTTETTYFTLLDATSPGLTTSDPNFSVANSDSAACYCRGTLILTDRGDAPVEQLAIGDIVITASGQRRFIKWLGRRSYAGRFMAANPNVRPIRFRIGSLGAGLPMRDLLVSPEHAMFIDGVLVPARCLVNGTTVAREPGMSRVDYYHVELDSHDVILAEGAPSESFMDDDSRGIFHNAQEFVKMYPGAPAPSGYCARRIESGYELEAIRLRLAAIAAPSVADAA